MRSLQNYPTVKEQHKALSRTAYPRKVLQGIGTLINAHWRYHTYECTWHDMIKGFDYADVLVTVEQRDR